MEDSAQKKRISFPFQAPFCPALLDQIKDFSKDLSHSQVPMA